MKTPPHNFNRQNRSVLEKMSDAELLGFYQQLDEAEKQHRVSPISFYKPNPKAQDPFHRSKRRIRVLLGGNRSGKTTAGSCESIAHAFGFRPWLREDDPDYRVRLGSGKPIPVPNVGTVLGESYKISVDRVLIPTLMEWMPSEHIESMVKSQQAVVDTIILKNKSKIRLMTYNQDPKEFEGFKAHWTWYDEPPKHSIFIANERSLVDYGGRSWFTMTPIRQPWIWDEIVSKEGMDARIDVFKMSIWDNAISRGGYLQDRFINEFLDSLPAEERKSRESGEFLHLQGRVFPNWIPKPPYWVPNFPPKAHWVRVMGIDPHPRKPVACIWYAISPDSGIWYAYRELYDDKLRTVKDVVNKIKLLERGEHVSFRIMDNAGLENERTSGTSVYEQFADEGILCELAEKTDKDGRRRVLRELLEIDTVYETPGLVVMDTCPRLRHEFMNHVWDEWAPATKDNKDPKPESIKKDDDMIDCTMYLLQYGTRAEEFDSKLLERKFKESGSEYIYKPVFSGGRTGY